MGLASLKLITIKEDNRDSKMILLVSEALETLEAWAALVEWVVLGIWEVLVEWEASHTMTTMTILATLVLQVSNNFLQVPFLEALVHKALKPKLMLRMARKSQRLKKLQSTKMVTERLKSLKKSPMDKEENRKKLIN